MAFIRIALIAALVVAAIADPLRYRRQSVESIAQAGALAADGQGSAHDAHNAAVVVLGAPGSPGSGWGSEATPGIPASIVISNAGGSEVSQQGAILEVTSNDGAGNLAGLQTVGVAQDATAGDSLQVLADGAEIALGSSSDAGAEGSGASAAAAAMEIHGNSANLGLSHN